MPYLLVEEKVEGWGILPAWRESIACIPLSMLTNKMLRCSDPFLLTNALMGDSLMRLTELRRSLCKFKKEQSANHIIAPLIGVFQICVIPIVRIFGIVVR